MHAALVTKQYFNFLSPNYIFYNHEMHQLCAQIKPDPLQLPNEPVSRQDSITDISQCTHQFLVAHDFTKVNFGICAVCNDPIDEPGSKCELW